MLNYRRSIRLTRCVVNTILLIGLLTLIGSCSKYLDVVPQGKADIADIYKTERQAQNFLFRLYDGIPDRVSLQSNYDLNAGGDFQSGWYGSVRYFSYKSLIYDQMESPSNTYFAYWTTEGSFPEGVVKKDMFKAIRNCYNFLDNIQTVPDISAEHLKEWTGEALFLIAYYHQTLLDLYGPIPLVKREIPLDAEEDEIYPTRRPYNECVDFIANMYDSANIYLRDKQGISELGRADKVASLGMKSRLLLYAASPLINGNSEFYSDFVNPDGEHLIPQTYDVEKWKRAMDAASDAIDFAEAQGHKLFEVEGNSGLSDSIRGKINYHRAFVGDGDGSFWNTDEILFSYGNQGSISYNIHNIAPRIGFDKYSGLGFRGYIFPTWDAIHLWYTKNGLPLDVDPLTKDEDLYSVAPGDSTARLNRNRSPRFYASVGFDRGPYWLAGDTMIIHQRRGEVQQNDGDLTHEYQTDNGYFSQKWVSTGDDYDVTRNTYTYNKYAWPLLRLAELYLNYVEADFEYNGTLSGRSLQYLDMIRERSGLPDFEDSWDIVGGIPTGDDLRNIIHRERTNEFLLEGRRFHDIRRWKIAGEEMNRAQFSWNMAGETADDYYQVVPMREDGTRVFETPKNYWLAIPLQEMNTNSNLVQNPGY